MRHDIKVLNCRGSTKIGGGLAYYICFDVLYSLTELSHLNASNSDIEIQWIVLKAKAAKPLTIANLYKPPKATGFAFREYLTHCWDNLSDVNKREIYMMGDFNTNMLKTRDPDTKRLNSLMESHGTN